MGVILRLTFVEFLVLSLLLLFVLAVPFCSAFSHLPLHPYPIANLRELCLSCGGEKCLEQL